MSNCLGQKQVLKKLQRFSTIHRLIHMDFLGLCRDFPERDVIGWTFQELFGDQKWCPGVININWWVKKSHCCKIFDTMRKLIAILNTK